MDHTKHIPHHRRRPIWDDRHSAVRMIVISWCVGALMGLALAGTLIALNAGGLYDLIAGAGDQITPIALFAAGCSTLVASVWAAMSVMLMPWHD